MTRIGNLKTLTRLMMGLDTLMLAIFVSLSFFAHRSNLAVGDKLPLYGIRDLHGHEISFDQHKPVIIHYTAVHCKYCREETPEWGQLEKAVEKQAYVVYIVPDALEVNTQWNEQVGLFVPVSFAAKLNATNTPSTVVVGPDQTVMWRKVGELNMNDVKSITELVFRSASRD